MRLRTLTFPGLSGLLLIAAMTAGCQSVSRRSTDVELVSNASPKASLMLTGIGLPTRPAREVRRPAPVQLTGLSEDLEEGSANAASPPLAQKQTPDVAREAAAARDVRPIYFGQSGLKDPNADLPTDSMLFQTSGETTSKPKKSGVLFGDNPENLFRSQASTHRAAAAGEDPFAPQFQEDQSETEPIRTPPLFPPQAKDTQAAADTVSPYEQALAAPADPITFRNDLRCLLPTLWSDTKSLFSWQNAAVLGIAAGGAVAIRECGVDNDVRNYAQSHEERWGNGSVALRQLGEPAYQTPVIAGIYAYSLWRQDTGLHDYSRALISAYGLNGIATVTIKAIADTSRPTDDFYDGHWGFPSFHTSSLFTIGSVTEEYYGWQAGVPIYILGGLVGWSRIDQREHDLSDVMFGAVLGYVIGKSVGMNHREQDGRRQWNIQPYFDAQNGVNGLTLETKF